MTEQELDGVVDEIGKFAEIFDDERTSIKEVLKRKFSNW